MVDVFEFLLNKNVDSAYALVTYNGITEATLFTRYNDPRTWFLESPCELYRIAEFTNSIDEFAREYAFDILEEGVLEKESEIDDYINRHIKPMIVGNTLYEIENFQCSPYLPKHVDDIKLINSRECLQFLLENHNVK